MSSIETIVKNPTGLHARPAAQLSAFCKKFPNTVKISSGERDCNPKSIFSLLQGCFKVGDSVTIEADGDDAQSVAEQIAAFIDGLED